MHVEPKRGVFDTMFVGIFYYIALHLHVLHDEVGTIEGVCHDATNKGCCKNYGFGTFFIEEACYGLLVG